MTVVILEDPPKHMRPDKAIRADVAWKLFLPENMGDIPSLGKGKIEPIRHWLWWELSKRLGFLREEGKITVHVLTPALTPEAKDFLIRICSLWTNSVHIISCEGKDADLNSIGDNLWTPPVVNVKSEEPQDPALKKLTEVEENGTDTHYSPLLGAGKSYVRAYTIEKGSTYARFHSHTAREELYLILKGKGTVRIEKHNVPVKEGDLVAKPLGPDISTQFLADRGESMRVLDIEIWPEDEKVSKDAVAYPDHGELDLFGQGWDFTVPLESIISFRDAMEHYGTGYWRKADGSWEPKEIPGHKTRKE